MIGWAGSQASSMLGSGGMPDPGVYCQHCRQVHTLRAQEENQDHCSVPLARQHRLSLSIGSNIPSSKGTSVLNALMASLTNIKNGGGTARTPV